MYGRITAVGEINMKHDTFEKAVKAITCSLLLFSMAAQADLSMAFGGGPVEGDKVVTVYDGDQKKVITTRTNSFKKVLNDSDVTLKAYDRYWTSTDEVTDGSLVVVERAKPVTLVYKGKSKTIYTTQQTVQGVVNESGFDWKTVMPVEDGMTKVTKGMKIHVVPYTSRKVSRVESMPVEYNTWYDASLAPGQKVVVQEGTPGKREVEVEEYISDGKVIKTVQNHVHVRRNTGHCQKRGSRRSSRLCPRHECQCLSSFRWKRSWHYRYRYKSRLWYCSCRSTSDSSGFYRVYS